MRIKKTSETTPTTAQVVNQDSNSQTDTYSCNKINEKVKEVYSTTEQVIGTWIDGKPLYRKVINLGTITVVANSNVFNTNIENIENVIKTNYIFEKDGKIFSHWIHINAIDYLPSTNQIELFCNPNEAGTVLSNFKIILEYTKTTDVVS